VYVVCRGLLKLHYLQADGDEWIKSFSAEGMFFGSLSALQPGGLASFGVTALEDCELERLDYRELETLAERHPAWMAALYRAMRQFAALKEQREFELLALTPAERYAEFLRSQPGLAERLAQKDLARYLGITPVSLSRLRGRSKR
jgi:CRP-like cAMP-binding protein